MCILAQPLKSVSTTAIYAGANGDNSRQCVVYQMAVELLGSNAMILPVPARADSIKLIDMTDMPKFFDTLREIFIERSRGFSMNSYGAAAAGFLEVVDVGSYKVSIAPQIEDLNRINPAVFTVSSQVGKLLQFFYSEGYSFVVAQLNNSGEYHPLAYSHDMSPDGLFIPTRHQHGSNSERAMRIADDWDHQVYHHPGGPLVLNPRRVTEEVRRDEWSLRDIRDSLELKVPALAEFMPDTGISRKLIKGEGRNIDLQVAV